MSTVVEFKKPTRRPRDPHGPTPRDRRGPRWVVFAIVFLFLAAI